MERSQVELDLLAPGVVLVVRVQRGLPETGVVRGDWNPEGWRRVEGFGGPEPLL